MSGRDLDHDELRDAEIGRLAREKFSASCASILTGDAAASGIANLVLDKLAEPGAIAALARTALSCDAAVAGLVLRNLVADVLFVEAEADATKEVDAGKPLYYG